MRFQRTLTKALAPKVRLCCWRLSLTALLGAAFVCPCAGQTLGRPIPAGSAAYTQRTSSRMLDDSENRKPDARRSWYSRYSFQSERDTVIDLIEVDPEDLATDCGIDTVSFATDWHEFPADLWSDTRSILTMRNMLGIGLGAGLAAVSREYWDDDVRRGTAAHARRWGGANNVLDVVGHPATHFAATGLIYSTSLIADNIEAHDFSKSLLHSLLLTNGSVLVLKHSLQTRRPNGEPNGFPSGHTASAFAVAAVIGEHYGDWPGLAAHVAAGLVAWHRIDNRNHDLSDVLFGMVLGQVIGRAVSHNRLTERARLQVLPYAEPVNGTAGVLFERQF